MSQSQGCGLTLCLTRMQNQQDQIQGPMPPPAPPPPPPPAPPPPPLPHRPNMDINEDSVRSFSQLVKRAESDPGPEMRSSDLNGKFASIEDGVEGQLPPIIRQDSLASRASRKSLQQPPKWHFTNLVLKVTVCLLFLLIVCGVSVIFHFHQMEVHMLRLSQKIHLIEDNRVLTIERNSTFTALVGRLGMHLPDYEWPYDCSGDEKEVSQTHKCLQWKNRAQLDIYYESSQVDNTMAECHSIHWQDLTSFDHKDCYLIGDASWIGGGLLWHDIPSRRDVEALNFITTVTDDGEGAGHVLEPFWITTSGVSIFVDRQIPLTVSVKKLSFNRSKLRRYKYIAAPPKGRYMCLAPTISPQLQLKFVNATKWLNYTVCVGNNTKAVQQYAMKYKVPKLRPLKDKSIFMKPIFTATHLSADYTQNDVLEFAKTLHDAGLNGTLMINPGWETNPGDFTFDTQRFPNVTEMMQILRSYHFRVNLPVHPYVGVHSHYFGSDSYLELFIMDGTGRSPGLTRWKCYNCKEAIVAVMDLSHPEAAQELHNRITTLMDALKPDFLSFYGGDASSLPYMAYQSGPQINEYTRLYSTFAANTTDTVFLQSAYSAQGVNPFLMMPCDNSTWTSLKVLLKRVLTLGLIGYPNIMQGPIGGCKEGTLSEELFIRWLQMGTFFPLLHFSDVPGNMSSKASEVATNMLRIRNKTVVPVISKLLNDTSHNWPLVRPMWWFEPKSMKAFKATDQFMVGDTILVAPVVQQGATYRNIYIPRGHWRYGWNESVIHIGPKIMKSYKVQLEKIPFFVYKENKT